MENDLMKKNKKLELFKELINSDYKTRTLNSYADVQYRMNKILKDIGFVDKEILDIGCGKGLASIYLALNGAKNVIGIEPMLEGSSENSLYTFEKNIKEMELANCKAENATFQDFSAKPESFDIILSINSINHLNETLCAMIHNNEKAREYYLSQMKKAYGLIRPGGVFIIADCSCHNLFSQLSKIGIRNPMAPSIDWSIHQSPKTWHKVLLSAGFSKSSHWWHVPYRLSGFERLLSNPTAAWLTTSYFVIHAYK
ncbi:MAG: class I SAM-dependent methyltransferase [Deltaproteobacteria bacterium]|uniref:Class I SAM-dependent methyltransferase n=1 Tax=Candidatus Zymogenus saltonus TaxID=2844893 RepID=A0A9D8KG53_9DELT|nr:class I SAM-dependent methyltransferase [Candidatus Zymogenus saltonus]